MEEENKCPQLSSDSHMQTVAWDTPTKYTPNTHSTLYVFNNQYFSKIVNTIYLCLLIHPYIYSQPVSTTLLQISNTNVSKVDNLKLYREPLSIFTW